MGQNNDVLIIGMEDEVIDACKQFESIKQSFMPPFQLLDTSVTLGAQVFCGRVAAVSFSFLPVEELRRISQDNPDVRVVVMKNESHVFEDIAK